MPPQAFDWKTSTAVIRVRGLIVNQMFLPSLWCIVGTIMSYSDYFKGKKITVLGLGLLGRGVGDTAFLSQCGADLIVTDLKTETELRPSLRELKGYKNIQYVLGGHNLEDFRNRDMILKNPDIPIDSPYIREAEAHGIPIEMSASLVAKLTDATIIGVTGTRGKSTVTQLLYHILKEAKEDIHLAGNVRGVATLPVLQEITKRSYILMELDSWQLRGFGDSHISPHISVFTTFYPDHMNYYKNDMQVYFDDKANIFKFQTENDVLIITKQAKGAIEKYYKGNIKSKQVVVSPIKTDNVRLLGDHNKENAACAFEAARELRISDKYINKAITSFSGIEGRLQFVREVNGVKIYNDNNATTPDATIAALKALGTDIVLVMGGSDKGLDMSELISEIPKHCKSVVLFRESGTDSIADEVKNLPGVEVYEEESLKVCIKKAMSIAQIGDTLLYSPAFASFGKYFKNEYDRGDQFLEIVEKM